MFLVWNDPEYEKHEFNEETKIDKHYTLAEKLREALQRSDTQYTDSTDDSYAVDISISGSRTDADEGIRFAFDFYDFTQMAISISNYINFFLYVIESNVVAVGDLF